MNIAKLAFKNLWIRSTRTWLTIIGISIVIAIFFSIFSFGKGYEKALEGEFSSFGIHILAVPKGCPYEATSLLLHGGDIEGSLDFDQLEQVRTHPGILLASPLYSRHTKVTSPKNSSGTETALYAIEADLFKLKTYWNITRGSMFSAYDAQEVLLGHQIAQILQVEIADEVSFIVHVGEEKISVKGILTGILDMTGTSDDNFIFIPFGLIRTFLGDDEIIKAIAIQTIEGSSIAQVSEELSLIQDVQTVTYRQAQYTLRQLLDTTRQLLNLALWFTLLLGLIGLINTSLMSIEERKRELGMLKALGAKNYQLIRLIIFETAIMVLIGSILGILWSLALSSSIELIIRNLIESAPPGQLSMFSFPVAIITVGVSVVIASLSALLPSLSLLNISPLEVIRND